MELAGGLRGPPPAEVVERATRMQAQKAAAGAPPTQEEELAKLDTTPTPRFQVDDPGWLAHLNEEGYAVVADVASASEIEHAKDLLWQFLEESVGCQRSSPSTWTDERLERVGSVRNGILNSMGICQSTFMWYMRTLPKAHQVFEQIWGTSELLVSFDGANIFRPWHHGFRKTMCGWWHVDQGRGKQGRQAVQGLVSLFPSDGHTGGLTVVPRTHLRHAEVVEDQQNPKQDYCAVQPYSPVLQEEMQRRLVCCRAGDLVLWDSRTVHANAPAPQEPSGPKDELLRAAAYICMTPKAWAPADVRQRRRDAYKNGCGSSHWPHQLDVGLPGTPPVPLAEADPQVQRLVG